MLGITSPTSGRMARPATGTACAWVHEEAVMGLVLLIVLILLIVGGLPGWGYHSYGYGPSGIGGILLVILLILLLTGRL